MVENDYHQIYNRHTSTINHQILPIKKKSKFLTRRIGGGDSNNRNLKNHQDVDFEKQNAVQFEDLSIKNIDNKNKHPALKSIRNSHIQSHNEKELAMINNSMSNPDIGTII